MSPRRPTATAQPITIGVAAATGRAARLADTGGRHLLGITGAPGAGKSTLAAAVVDDLGPQAVLVPMDGFHLAQAELVRLGRADRKGAPDTFDAAGFVVLLERLRAADRTGPGADPTPWPAGPVYAPHFDRAIEDPVAGSIAVGPDVRLVVVEGNYLLHDDGAWSRVAALLDECWYVEVADELRIERLVARHVAFGKEPAVARAWVLGRDERNARLIAGSRSRATVVVRPT